MKTNKLMLAAMLFGAVALVSCDKEKGDNNVVPPTPTPDPEVVVPEVDEPTEGIVKFVVKIPTGSECKGVAIKGTYDGSAWSGKDTYLGADQNAQASPDSCITFKQLEGDWYTAEYAVLKDGYVSGDVTLFLAGKVCLIYSGDGSWEGQASSWDYIDAGSAVTSKSSDGNLQIESNTGVVYIEVKEWQKSECVTVEAEEYTLTVEGYDGAIYYAGDAFEVGWTPTLLPSNPFKFTAKPGDQFKIVADENWTAFAKEGSYNAETNCYSDDNIKLESGKNNITIKVLGVIDGETYIKCE